MSYTVIAFEQTLGVFCGQCANCIGSASSVNDEDLRTFVANHECPLDWAHPGRQQYCGPGCTDQDHLENRR